MKKNAEIKFRTTTEVKQELDSLAVNSFGLKKAECYEMIISFGLIELKKYISLGHPFKIEHIINSSSKKITFEEGKRK